jgi:hypothetical protein
MDISSQGHRKSEAKRLFILELNEFNRDLLFDAAKVYGYQNILRLKSLKEATTLTSDTYESDFLEPWVQWVNVHTGKESKTHQIKHLGDVPDCEYPQIWEALSKRSISSGVWGALNAKRGNAKHCHYFLPDPWTFSEQAYPDQLNGLLNFPRYLATHRTRLSVFGILNTLLPFLKTLMSFEILMEMFKRSPLALKTILKYPKHEFAGFCFLEYLSGLVFLNHWKKQEFRLGILFFNSIAHVQHYHWKGFDFKNNEKIKYCLYFIDLFLGKVYSELRTEDKLIVMNALSQENTNHEPPWVSYIPKNLNVLLSKARITYSHIESLMSYDGFVFFNDQDQMIQGTRKLKEASVQGRPLFLIEEASNNSLKVFFRLAFTDEVDQFVRFRLNDFEGVFLEHFSKVAIRQAKHISRGSLFTNLEDVPSNLPNHKVFNVVLDYFGIENGIKEPVGPEVAKPLATLD